MDLDTKDTKLMFVTRANIKRQHIPDYSLHTLYYTPVDCSGTLVYSGIIGILLICILNARFYVYNIALYRFSHGTIS